MGCNTSKESVPAENENKENQDGVVEKIVENKIEIKLSGNNTEVVENFVEETTDSKPASAKTITLHSNGSATVPTAVSPDKEDTKPSTAPNEDPANSTTETPEDPEDEERAATKIQAAFRGHKTRKSMKQPTGKVEPSKANSNSNEPTREELEAEFRLDDAELCHAATKIQASFRGHMTRKNKEDEEKKAESSTSQAKIQDPEEELDIDLSDPDLNKAAVKIQASFRGHMTRKDNEKEEPTK